MLSREEKIKLLIERMQSDKQIGIYEDNMCTLCNGSGEGMWDGSTCSSCKGSGVKTNKNKEYGKE